MKTHQFYEIECFSRANKLVILKLKNINTRIEAIS